MDSLGELMNHEAHEHKDSGLGRCTFTAFFLEARGRSPKITNFP